MYKQSPYSALGRTCIALLISTLGMLFGSGQAYANGQGPVGIWPVSERYTLVADTSLPGLVLVDLQAGIAAERLKMDNFRPVGVASCPGCNFVLISSGPKNGFLLLHLKGTTSELIQKTGKLGLDQARLEPLEVATGESSLVDGRMVLVAHDGKTAFIASSKDHAVFKVDFSKSPNAEALIRDSKQDPFGINWDVRGGLLVSMHKREVWRVTTDGEVQAVYDTKAAGCPGTQEFSPNLRAAVDDPVNKDSVLILATNPRTYDAVVWRLQVDAQGEQSCINAAGEIGPGPGWIDETGVATAFSRPHYFSLRPDTLLPQLIISDIDNRALRLLDLSTYAAATVMYNRDHTLTAVTPEARASKTACTELGWPIATTASGQTATPFCISQPKSNTLKLTLAQAKAHCSAQGARLCEPAELLATDSAPETLTWTSAECASCWHRKAGEHCGADIVDHKTLGISHHHEEYSESWHSGQALVAFDTAAGKFTATVCRVVEDSLTAAATCCAD